MLIVAQIGQNEKASDEEDLDESVGGYDDEDSEYESGMTNLSAKCR